MRCSLLALLLTLPATTSAQLPAIGSQALVRLELDSGRSHQGTLVSQTDDTLTLSKSGATAFSSESIRRIRVSSGRSSGLGARHGAARGAVIVGGGFALVFIGAYLGSPSSNKGELATWVAVALVVGGIEGAFIGGVIGGLVGAEKWSTVYSRPRQTRVVESNKPARLGLSFAF